MQCSKSIKLKYIVTYSLADDVEYIIKNKEDVEVASLINKFFKNLAGEYSWKFEKYSILHKFIAYIFQDQMYYPVEYKDDIILDSLANDEHYEKLEIEALLSLHNIQHTSLSIWLARNNLSKNLILTDDLLDYYAALKKEGSFSEMCEIVAEEVFFIIFMNRELLRLFNELIASIRSNSGYTSLKRVYMPKWVRRAVYFRDRGRCVICNRDLSGITH
jgi:hypothetical protein